MGARQSYLYIFLEDVDTKRRILIDDKYAYSVESCKGLYTDCDNFEFVKYKIDYDPGDGTNFDIYIYNTKNVVTKDRFVFAYCSPAKNQVATKVEVYYSVLSPQPLVITFVTKNGHTHNCPVDRLKSVGWDWASNITEYDFKDLAGLLKKEYQKISWDKTIKFTTGGDNQHVKGQKQEIDDGTYYRVILLPEEKESVLGSDCLCSFTFENSKFKCVKSPNGNKNKIDPYYLTPVINKYHTGIILYFSRKPPITKNDKGKAHQEKDFENTLLLVEFIYSCKTISLRRKDKECCLWTEEQVMYKKYKDRFDELEKIKKDTEGTDINTIFLDSNSGNICHTKVKSEEKNVYNKYPYKFSKKTKTVMLFERKIITIGPITSEVQAKNVDVYYLKVKGAKNVEDDKPFLIALYEDADDKPKKAYHFKYGFGFDKWEEFEKVEQLQGKLDEIDQSINCSFNIDMLRMMVYDILTRDKPSPPPEVPPEEKEERPKTVEPETRPEGLSLLLIIGCSVGGVLLIIGLAVGYGVYWYNTTIKLLT